MDQKPLGVSPVLCRFEIYWMTEKVFATFSMVGHVDVTRLSTGELCFVLFVLLNHMRKRRKRSLAVSNIRRKSPRGCSLVPNSFFLLLFFFPSQPLKTLCFTPLKQALETWSNFAVVLETAFGLLVDRVNEWRRGTLKSNFGLVTSHGSSPFGS